MKDFLINLAHWIARRYGLKLVHERSFDQVQDAVKGSREYIEKSGHIRRPGKYHQFRKLRNGLDRAILAIHRSEGV